MKKFVLPLFAAGLMLALATPAQANPTCFEWLCYVSNKQCVFDAGCSEDGGDNAIEYDWTFGDGGTYSATNNPLAGHTYSSGAYSTVTLRVGFLLIGYYQVSCPVQFAPVIGGDYSTTYSGRCE